MHFLLTKSELILQEGRKMKYKVTEVFKKPSRTVGGRIETDHHTVIMESDLSAYEVAQIVINASSGQDGDYQLSVTHERD